MISLTTVIYVYIYFFLNIKIIANDMKKNINILQNILFFLSNIKKQEYLYRFICPTKRYNVFIENYFSM
jgi:hypothetical protein